jgi:murein DD-endopeptidase MepM/ murein hydrolase activator NlpD
MGTFAIIATSIPKTTVALEGTWEKLPANATYFKTIETTPQGIMAGEYDTRAWTEPFNGLYISENLGESWHIHALGERGVNDITYFEGKTYAATYYSVGGISGLFVNEGDNTWTHIGPKVSTTTVERDSETIYLGTYSHGMWISRDEGVTWKQKLGAGWYGPRIDEIVVCADTLYTATEDGVYKSLGQEEIFENVTFFNDKLITSVFCNAHVALIGTSTELFSSYDQGNTWNNLPFFTNYIVTAMADVLGTYYIGARTESSTKLFLSNDLLNWKETNINLPLTTPIIDIAAAYSDPTYIYALALHGGIYRHEIFKMSPEVETFMEIPWNAENPTELVDRLTAYFDHEYPLLGYLDEPSEAKNTTVSFWGNEEAPPKLQYSSHSGTDFWLEYDTPIKSVAAGLSEYHWCDNCGHTIKVNHQNGYQSVYMHLQETGLITRAEPIWVVPGQNIGKVGLTGNTSGPHLHLEVLKDTRGNGDFLGEVPFGRVDPFGWQSINRQDPWPNFSGGDSENPAKGTKSEYLWKVEIPALTTFITPAGGYYAVENKAVQLKPNALKNSATILVQNGPRPEINSLQSNQKLKYISNSALVIDIYDITGTDIETLLVPAQINIQLTEEDFANYKQDTLAIYHLSNTTGLWEKLNTATDPETLYLTAETTKLSRFAVFGEPKRVSKVKVSKAMFFVTPIW